MTSPTRSFFIDSSVVLYASGAPHRMRDACHQLLVRSNRAEVSLHASVEMIQEFVFHRMRKEPAGIAADKAAELSRAVTLHPFDESVLDRSVELIRTGTVRGRDAVHAATALEAGFDAIVSSDRDFDGIPGLRRIDPADLADELESHEDHPPG